MWISYYITKNVCKVHLELRSVIVTHLQLQGQSSAMDIFNQLADLAKGLSLDIVSASCNENTTRATCRRPKFIITLEQLEFLRRMRYTWRQIASFLDVSVSTISRRRTELGYLEENEYSLLADNELDDIIRDLR